MARKPKPVAPTLWDRCKQITIYQAAVFLIAAGSTLTPGYVVVKSIAANAADTYFQKKLQQSGLEPKEIKKALEKIEKVDKDNLAVQSDLATVKAQNRANQELLEKLLELQLQNQ